MYKVVVTWGEMEDITETYKFKTHKEAVAFAEGVDAAVGWLDATYSITKESEL